MKWGESGSLRPFRLLQKTVPQDDSRLTGKSEGHTIQLPWEMGLTSRRAGPQLRGGGPWRGRSWPPAPRACPDMCTGPHRPACMPTGVGKDSRPPSALRLLPLLRAHLLGTGGPTLPAGHASATVADSHYLCGKVGSRRLQDKRGPDSVGAQQGRTW